jgi:hypothetical protein
VTTSARRRLDGPWSSDRWRDYRPKTPLGWFALAFMVLSFAGGIVIGIWSTGGF